MGVEDPEKRRARQRQPAYNENRRERNRQWMAAHYLETLIRRNVRLNERDEEVLRGYTEAEA